jgi:hypothetical protein
MVTRLSIGLAVLGVLPAGAGQAQPPSLHLVCLGAGSANRPTSTSVYVTNSAGNSGWGQVVGRREVPFEDQVNIEVDGAESRIRMPRTMLPAIHGGDGGWFKLKNVKVTDAEITGSAAVNMINNPKVRIDRITGTISIDGRSGTYSGECQAYDPANAPRKF